MKQAPLRNELLALGFSKQNTVFAGGQTANNKLNLDHETLTRDPNVFSRVLDGLVQAASPYGPEFVVGVPNGATGLAAAVAREMDLYNPHLAKTPDGTIDYKLWLDEDTVDRLHVGVVVEDVLNRRSTTDQVLQLRGLGSKVVAVVSVFDRGVPGEAIELGKPVHSLVTEPIPPMLPEDEPIWRFAA